MKTKVINMPTNKEIIKKKYHDIRNAYMPDYYNNKQIMFQIHAIEEMLNDARVDGEITKTIRKAVADYMQSEGCSCCSNIEEHGKAKKKLAKLLNVPKYDDGSGYNFNKFATNK